MQRELVLKCSKCGKIMNFDFYIKKFICHNCNERITLDKLTKENSFIETKDNFKEVKELSINFPKNEFLKELKKKLKYKVLAPSIFLKVKKYKEENVDLIYIPLIIYGTECAYFDNQEKDYKYYKISNMIFDENTDFDKETLNSLYPINIVEDNIQLSKVNFKNIDNNFEDIIPLIQKKVKNNLVNHLNICESDIIFLNEKIEYLLLPIYDIKLKYKNKEYHLSMNANTGKISIKVSLDMKKLFFTFIIFLVVDIIFFEISHLLRMIEEFCIVLSIFLCIIQTLSITCMYLFTKTFNEKINNKNKYYIKMIK